MYSMDSNLIDAINLWISDTVFTSSHGAELLHIIQIYRSPHFFLLRNHISLVLSNNSIHICTWFIYLKRVYSKIFDIWFISYSPESFRFRLVYHKRTLIMDVYVKFSWILMLSRQLILKILQNSLHYHITDLRNIYQNK